MRHPIVGPLRQACFPPGLIVNYSPTIALHRMEAEMLKGPNVVQQMQVEAKISQARPDELRWCIIVNTCLKALPLSTQRNRLRRKWAAAFQDSLKKQGLAKNGKREMSQAHMPHTPELAGTLELVIFHGYGFEEDARELRERTDKVLQALFKFGQGTRRITPNTYSSRDQRGGR